MTLADLGSTSPVFRRDHRDRSLPAQLFSPMLVATALALLVPSALAQTPIPLGGPPCASAKGYTALPGGLLFTAYTPNGGHEPWISDGTSGGTHQLADINPGSGSCGAEGYVTTSTGAYFSAYTPATGYELYQTDGTQGGTSLVLDIEPGPLDSFPQEGIVWRDVLYFRARTNASGQEVWRSDGTAAGTYLLLDIEPGPTGSVPHHFLVTDSMLYFSAETSANGREVWQTDGTAVGTSMLADLDPGSGSSYPIYLSKFEGSIYFLAREPATGLELYKSDGSSTGTVRMADLMPGPTDGVVSILGVAGGRLLLSARDLVVGLEIFATDGISVVPVGDIHPGPSGTPVDYAVEAAGNVFFVSSEQATGSEVWVTDGTLAGTHITLDIVPGAFTWETGPLVALNGRAFFAAGYDPVSGLIKFWVTDGTPAGTHVIADTSLVLLSGPPHEGIRRVGDRVYFTRTIPQAGNAPWYVEEAPGVAFCFGDGSEPGLLACPCGNVGAPGNGCANSLAGSTGARLDADGQHRPDEVVLSASGVVPNEITIFFQGDLVQTGGTLFGDGVRCVAGTIVRLALKTASSSGVASFPEAGEPSVTTRSAERGDPIAQGSTRLYQAWYRDPAGAFCPSAVSNATNAVSIDW